jgi:hypothetical protein
MSVDEFMAALDRVLDEELGAARDLTEEHQALAMVRGPVFAGINWNEYLARRGSK